MLALSFVVLIPLYAILAARASRAGMIRLWLAAVACVVLIAAAASIAAAATARERPIRVGIVLAAVYAVPVVTASLGAWARPGRTVSALAGGVLGLLAVFGGLLYVSAGPHSW